MAEIVNILNWSILWYLIALSLGYAILLAASIPDIFYRFKQSDIGDIKDLMKSHKMIPVTVIIPAYNEEDSILNAVYSVLKSSYGDAHIIIVNDGSTDNTLAKVKEVFDLEKIHAVLPRKVETKGKVRGYYISKYNINVTLIDKENSGKSDSLNVALNACRTPLFITLDADTVLEHDAIANIIFYMVTHEKTVAVGGAVYILNGCVYKDGEMIERKMSMQLLYALQSCEYMRSFLFSRSGWNTFSGALSFAGAFTLFDHKSVIDVGGFDRDNLAQDFEIISHLHASQREQKNNYTIGYTASAVAWTDVPGNLVDLWHQRYNWQKDSLRSLLLHKRMLFNPRYGIIGLFNYPFYLFGETLGVVVEFSAYVLVLLSWYFGILDTYWALLFVAICWGFVTFITMATALMNFITYDRYRRLSDLLWLLLIVAIESFGYRQILVACRIKATLSYFFDKLIFWK
jgi:cellulose synthase/poly-beta-1,6-N-acetylglucosamine synthase-like glycosyltransferase